MHNMIHDSGLGVGWMLIAAGNLLSAIVDHGMAVLSVASLVFGMLCQGLAVWLRWCDHRDGRRRSAR
jgi:hypothetical protein